MYVAATNRNIGQATRRLVGYEDIMNVASLTEI
jgi:hypothetical protein